MHSNPRPEGVTLLRATGQRIPLELSGESYLDDSGIRVWMVDTPVDFRAGDRYHIDVMPPKTAIEFPVVAADGDYR